MMLFLSVLFISRGQAKVPRQPIVSREASLEKQIYALGSLLNLAQAS
jgi:hypothetical protein